MHKFRSGIQREEGFTLIELTRRHRDHRHPACDRGHVVPRLQGSRQRVGSGLDVRSAVPSVGGLLRQQQRIGTPSEPGRISGPRSGVQLLGLRHGRQVRQLQPVWPPKTTRPTASTMTVGGNNAVQLTALVNGDTEAAATVCKTAGPERRHGGARIGTLHLGRRRVQPSPRTGRKGEHTMNQTIRSTILLPSR